MSSINLDKIIYITHENLIYLCFSDSFSILLITSFAFFKCFSKALSMFLNCREITVTTEYIIK